MTMATTSNNTKEFPHGPVLRSAEACPLSPKRLFAPSLAQIANKANTAIKASLENPCKIRVDVNQATPFLLMTGKI